jgi:predicted double-glycine peptidase
MITPQLGLVDPSGIEATAKLFGFKTVWSNSWQLDQIIDIANQGKPVIVSFPPDRYDGGHILVVLGGDSDVVSLADTSLWNRKELTRSQFLQWWEGFGAVVTPT